MREIHNLGRFPPLDSYSGQLLWEGLNNCFDFLPLAATINGKVFCVHGGIPRTIAIPAHLRADPAYLATLNQDSIHVDLRDNAEGVLKTIKQVFLY